MKNYLICICLLINTAISFSWAETLPEKFHIGRVEVFVDENNIAITAQDQKTIMVDVLPGGKYWPPIAQDEQGYFFIGNKIVDTNSGKITEVGYLTGDGILLNSSIGILPDDAHQRFQIKSPRSNCVLGMKAFGLDGKNTKSATELLKDRNITFIASDREILALEMRFNAEGNISSYRVQQINPLSCKVQFSKDIGNPDLLVQIGWSKDGGWWLVGSIEQTLLRSRDGRHWRKVDLPKNIYSLVSGYVVSPNEIWLAAGLASKTKDDDPLLLRSMDGGRTWYSLKKEDKELNALPRYWLEGLIRKS